MGVWGTFSISWPKHVYMDPDDSGYFVSIARSWGTMARMQTFIEGILVVGQGPSALGYMVKGSDVVGFDGGGNGGWVKYPLVVRRTWTWDRPLSSTSNAIIL
jgi:hypothetical protein